MEAGLAVSEKTATDFQSLSLFSEEKLNEAGKTSHLNLKYIFYKKSSRFSMGCLKNEG
jgi:hypothetical protein